MQTVFLDLVEGPSPSEKALTVFFILSTIAVVAMLAMIIIKRKGK